MKKIGLVCMTTLIGLSLAACSNNSSIKNSASSSSHSSSKVVKHKKHSSKETTSSSSSVSQVQQNSKQTQQSQHSLQNRLEADREQAARTGALTQAQLNDPSNFDSNGNFTEQGWEAMEGINWNNEYNDTSWEQHPSPSYHNQGANTTAGNSTGEAVSQ